MNVWAILQSFIIVAFANTAPFVAKKVFGARFCHPVDGGLTFFDKRPLLGPSIRACSAGRIAIFRPVRQRTSRLLLAGVRWRD